MHRLRTRPLGAVIVRGASMLPTLRDGDRLLVRYGRSPRPGMLAVARLPDATVVIKRAVERREGGWWLLSDNAAAGRGDSRAWGTIADGQILAVALVRLWPRPSRLRRRQAARP